MAYLKLQDDQGRSIRVIVLNESEDGTGVWHVPLVDSSGNLKAVLVAGAAAIGKLAANSGVDIGDVDVTSVIPGSGATNLGKAEDAAHTSGDTGVLLLAVRQDTAAALAGTDADYIPLIVDANGRLHVLDANSAAVKTAVELIDNAISGNEMQVDVVAALPAGDNNIGNVDIVSGGGGTEYAVDAALGATPTGTAAIAKRDDALSALTPVEGDAIELRVDANGALWTHDDALDAALGGSELQVDIVAALPAGTNAIGRVGHDTTGLGHGVKTVSTVGTDEALAGSTACKWVVIQAQTDNTNKVAVGATGVDATVATGNGLILDPGDWTPPIYIDNLADIFIDALVAGEGCRYIYGT